jgi:hypothetical protein
MSKVMDAVFFATPPAIPRWMAGMIPARIPVDHSLPGVLSGFILIYVIEILNNI